APTGLAAGWNPPPLGVGRKSRLRARAQGCGFVPPLWGRPWHDGGRGFVSFPKPVCIVRRDVASGCCCHGNWWCVQKVTCSPGGFRTSVLTRKIGHNADCEGIMGSWAAKATRFVPSNDRVESFLPVDTLSTAHALMENMWCVAPLFP